MSGTILLKLNFIRKRYLHSTHYGYLKLIRDIAVRASYTSSQNKRSIKFTTEEAIADLLVVVGEFEEKFGKSSRAGDIPASWLFCETTRNNIEFRFSWTSFVMWVSEEFKKGTITSSQLFQLNSWKGWMLGIYGTRWRCDINAYDSSQSFYFHIRSHLDQLPYVPHWLKFENPDTLKEFEKMYQIKIVEDQIKSLEYKLEILKTRLNGGY